MADRCYVWNWYSVNYSIFANMTPLEEKLKAILDNYNVHPNQPKTIAKIKEVFREIVPEERKIEYFIGTQWAKNQNDLWFNACRSEILKQLE